MCWQQGCVMGQDSLHQAGQQQHMRQKEDFVRLMQSTSRFVGSMTT
jgi:hypothetical protein